MRWPLFAFVTFLALALQIGTQPLLHIGQVWPSWLLILMVMIAMWATPMETAWAALTLGLIDDLTSRFLGMTVGGNDFMLIGPGTLGMIIASFTVFQLRGMMFRDSPLAASTLVFVGGLIWQLVLIALIMLRGSSWIFDMPITGWHASDQLVHGFQQTLYSCVLALPVGWAFRKTIPWWGFASHKGRTAPR